MEIQKFAGTATTFRFGIQRCRQFGACREFGTQKSSPGAARSIA